MAQVLIRDYREAALSREDRALCDYAAKLTVAPGAMTSADVHWLRGFGFDDDAISIVVQVIGYFNYINRVADGLGVDSEEGMEPAEGTWFPTKGRGYSSTLPGPLRADGA